MSSFDDDDSSSSHSHLRKKRRTVIRSKKEKEVANGNPNQYKACDECKRIKKRCEGGVPCTRCVSMGLTCNFNQRPSKSYIEELQKRIKDLEDQVQQKELEKSSISTLMEAKYKEDNAKVITRAAKLCKLSTISDVLTVFNDAIGPNLQIRIPYKDISDFLTDDNPTRVSLMNLILATGSKVIGDSSHAIQFESEVTSKTSSLEGDTFYHMATLVLMAFMAVNRGDMEEADKHIIPAINIGQRLLLKKPDDQPVQMLLWKALEMKISWSTMEELMKYIGLFMQQSATYQFPLFDQLRNILYGVGMAAQEALRKRTVFAFKSHQPLLDRVVQSLETLPPWLRAQITIRLTIVQAWCCFAAHMYTEAEAYCDRAMEMCLYQLQHRAYVSAYTLAAMFTMHQIYLCNHSPIKMNRLVELFKEISKTSGWARICLQNITAYMSGYRLFPFFDKIVITDVFTDFGVAVPVQANTNEYYNSDSESSSGRFSNNSSIDQTYVPDPATQYPNNNNNSHQRYLPPQPLSQSQSQPQSTYYYSSNTNTNFYESTTGTRYDQGNSANDTVQFK